MQAAHQDPQPRSQKKEPTGGSLFRRIRETALAGLSLLFFYVPLLFHIGLTGKAGIPFFHLLLGCFAGDPVFLLDFSDQLVVLPVE